MLGELRKYTNSAPASFQPPLTQKTGHVCKWHSSISSVLSSNNDAWFTVGLRTWSDMRKILFARLIVHVHATQVPTIHATVLLNHKGFDLFDILWYDWYLTIVEPFYGCRCLQVAVMTHIISPDYDQVIFVELNLKQLRSWLSLIFSLSKLTQPSSLRSTFEIFLAIHPTTKGVLCLQQALNHVACHGMERLPKDHLFHYHCCCHPYGFPVTSCCILSLVRFLIPLLGTLHCSCDRPNQVQTCLLTTGVLGRSDL